MRQVRHRWAHPHLAALCAGAPRRRRLVRQAGRGAVPDRRLYPTGHLHHGLGQPVQVSAAADRGPGAGFDNVDRISRKIVLLCGEFLAWSSSCTPVSR